MKRQNAFKIVMTGLMAAALMTAAVPAAFAEEKEVTERSMSFSECVGLFLYSGRFCHVYGRSADYN